MARRSEIAEAIVEAIGLGPAQCLIQHYGGKQIQIPDGSGRGGVFSLWLDKELGVEAARQLKAMFGGERITVPMCKAQLLSARNALIVADYDQGRSLLELVRKYQLTERQIRTILNTPLGDARIGTAVVDDRQMGLF